MSVFTVVPFEVTRYSVQVEGEEIGTYDDQFAAAEVAARLNALVPFLPDVTPPSAVANLQVDPYGLVTWSASSDPDVPDHWTSNLVGYSINVGGYFRATVFAPNTSFQLGEQEYGLIEVWAFDGEGNFSAPSQVTFTDTIVPPAPTGVAVDEDGLLTWTASTATDVVGYAVRKNGYVVQNVSAPSTSYQIPSGEYGFYTVSAYDSANVSPPSAAVEYAEPIPQAPARSVYLQPGSISDRPNTPTASGAQFTNYAHFNPASDFPVGYNVERDIVVLGENLASWPLIPVYKHIRAESGNSFAADYSRHDRLQPLEILCYIRCPISFEANEISGMGETKGNGCAYAVGEDNRTLHHLYQFSKWAGDAWATAKSLNTWPSAQYSAYGKFIDALTHFGSHGGSMTRGFSIRYWEALLLSPIDHALSMIMPSAFRYRPPGVTDTTLPVSNGSELWTWRNDMHRIGPAIQGDSVSGYTGTDPYRKAGSFYSLPTDISASMRTTPGRNLAITLYNFGVYDCDAGAGQPGFAWAIEPAGNARTRFADYWGYSPRVINWSGQPRTPSTANGGENAANFVLDLDLIFSSLRVVKNPERGGFDSGTPRRIPVGPIIETF